MNLVRNILPHASKVQSNNENTKNNKNLTSMRYPALDAHMAW